MTGEEWIKVFENICSDMGQPLGYLPQGLLLGLVSLPVFWLGQRFLRRNRRPDWVRIVFLACCIVYVFVLSNMTFFCREPGSRTEVNLQLFGTWKSTPASRGFVIENIILFLPFGILFPCALPFLRRAWCCVPAACLCSIGIEGLQFVTQRGHCQLDDVVMNTAGAGVGWLFYRIILHKGILAHEKKINGAMSAGVI